MSLSLFKSAVKGFQFDQQTNSMKITLTQQDPQEYCLSLWVYIPTTNKVDKRHPQINKAKKSRNTHLR